MFAKEGRAICSGSRAFTVSYTHLDVYKRQIVDNSILKFEFSVPEKYAAHRLQGQKIKFRTTGSEKIYTAQVYAVDPLIDVKTRMILLRARFDNRANELMPGMFAKGNLIVDGKNEYIAIPTEAVVPEMDGRCV